MKPKVRISKRVVDTLIPGDMVWDSSVPGFGVRLQSKHPSYVLLTTIQGRQRWITIGRHGVWTPDTARDEALKILASVRDGKGPKALGTSRVRMAELAARYIDEHAVPFKKSSSVLTDRKNLQNHILPLLGHRYVSDIDKADILALQRAIRTGKTAPSDPLRRSKDQGGGKVAMGGPGVANRCLTLLSKMFNLAEDWGLRPNGSNPVRGIQRFPERPCERFLSEGELHRLGRVLDLFENETRESVWALAAIRLLMLTGARLSEIVKLRWDFVDLDAGLLRLPDSKTGRKTVVLSDTAIELLIRLPKVSGNPFVIVGGREGAHLVDLQRPWQRVRAAADLHDVRLHDLRHSFASLGLKKGIPLAVIGKVLGHKSPATTARYAHLSETDVEAAAREIGRHFTNALKS